MGAFIAILGTVLPPLIILSVISLFYTAFKGNEAVQAVLKGMSAGVAAVVADVTLTMGKEITDEKRVFSIIIMIDVTPGSIAINAATFVGTRISRTFGAIVATLGCVTPSCIIVLTIAYFYYKYQKLWIIQGALSGLRPAVVALIASSGLSILLMSLFGEKVSSWLAINISNVDFTALFLFAAGFFILRKFKANPIYIMLGLGVIGLIIYKFS